MGKLVPGSLLLEELAPTICLSYDSEIFCIFPVKIIAHWQLLLAAEGLCCCSIASQDTPGTAACPRVEKELSFQDLKPQSHLNNTGDHTRALLRPHLHQSTPAVSPTLPVQFHLSLYNFIGMTVFVRIAKVNTSSLPV